MDRRIELALRLVTGAALVVAAGALLWSPSLTHTDIAPVTAEAERTIPPPPRPDAELARAILAGDVFARARHAPATRYRPPGAASAGTTAETATPAAGVPRLYGIVPGPGGAGALLWLDRSVASALLYHEGDRGGGYRVESIGDQSVVLAGPSGRVELRLSGAGAR